MFQTDANVCAEGLEKSFGSVKVLDRISFTIKKGGIFALLGANGAGKTTTIRILAALLKPDKGSARICGFDTVSQSMQVKRQISLTGQFAAVDDVLTGRENLRMIGKLRHVRDINTKVAELLERFELSQAADRYVVTYSGGMRRKLDLAMSLLGDPSVIFLDEPTTGLDPKSRITMWKIIKELSQSGITVFLTTQYLDEADHLADRIAILDKGKIVAEGTAAELKRLIPHGHIELRFQDEKDIQATRDLLVEYSTNSDKENLAVLISTDGSIRQLTDILNRLEKSNIPVLELVQKQPTLEDVFLAITGEKQGKEELK